MSFLLLACIQDILENSGFWSPLPDPLNNYFRWRKSAIDIGAWNNRGLSGLKQLPGEDAIIDVCSGTKSGAIGLDARNPVIADRLEKYSSVFSCDDVTEENSWVILETKTTLIRDQHVVTHKPAQAIEHKKSSPATLKDKESTTGNTRPQKLASASDPKKEPLPDIVENTARPTQMVLLQGRAARLKYKIPPQEIKRVSGHDVIEKSRYQEQEERAWFFGCPMYVARWWIILEIPNGYIDAIETQKNPHVCGSDTKGTEV